MMMPFAEPKTEMATRMEMKDPAHGPSATVVASMATTPDAFTAVMATIVLEIMALTQTLGESN